MARLIDANALISYMDECSKESRFRVYYGYAESFINASPTIDAVPVVRCRECKYHNKPPCPMRLSFNWTEDNDFCSYGERKDGDSDG